MRKPKKFENSLQYKYPEACLYFDFEKNYPLVLSDLFPKSDKVVFWRCHKDGRHQWRRPVKDQTRSIERGTSCLYCSHKRPSVDYNLTINNPSLMHEWCYYKNIGIDPSKVLPMSDKVVFWICPNDPDHVYEMPVKKRAGRGDKCPYCRNIRQDKKRSLGALYPELSQEWHPTKNGPLSPFDVAPKSDKRVYWQCRKDSEHVWFAQVKNRTNEKHPTGCPFCANRLVCDSNRLNLIYPHIAIEWNYEKNGKLKPSDVTYGSNKIVWWKCLLNGHEWTAAINGRTSNDSSCPYCNYSTSRAELYVLFELRLIFESIKWREIIARSECDIYISKYKLAIEIDGKYWHKDKYKQDKNKNSNLIGNGITVIRLREEPLSKISSDDIVYSGKMSPNIVLSLLNKIRSLTALDSNDLKKVNWWSAEPKQRNSDKYMEASRYIGRPLSLEDSAAISKFVVANWDYEKNRPLTPRDFSPGSGAYIYWQCENKREHKWRAKISHVFRGSECPFCKGNLADEDTCLSSTHPEVAKQWSPNNKTKPSKVKYASSLPALWICDEGHEYERAINSQVLGAKCPICASLEVRFPNIAAEWHPRRNGNLTPRGIGAKSTKQVWWLCKQGHEWKESCHSRTNSRSKSRCKECRSLAFLFPHLSRQFHPSKNGTSKPKDIFVTSKKNVWWLCQHCGHEWEEVVGARTARKNNPCPGCSRCP